MKFQRVIAFALAATAILLAVALLVPPTVEAAPDSPPEIAVASYSGPPTADAESPVSDFNLTSAQACKGVDITVEVADAMTAPDFRSLPSFSCENL